MYACGKGKLSGFQNSKEQGQMPTIKRVMNFYERPETISFAVAGRLPFCIVNGYRVTTQLDSK